jgi:hypothetical protein
MGEPGTSGVCWGSSLATAGLRKAEGGTISNGIAGEKRRKTPPRRARRLWTHAGVGVVEGTSLLAQAGRGDGRWNGGPLEVAQDAGNHRFLGEGRKAPSAHAVAEEWRQ